MGRWRRWTQQGEWMRELRERCALNHSDVERQTDRIARRTGNRAFHVSRPYLRNIELGESVPSTSRMKALAEVYGRSSEELLARYGMELEERGNLFASFPSSSGTRSNPAIDDEEELRLSLAVASRFRSKETVLLNEAEDALVIPARWRERLGGKPVRFAVIGTEDDRMGKLLPAGSLVAVDTRQKTIDDTPALRTEADRPIYLVWLDKLYVCCWAYQVGNNLTLIPYQPSPKHEVMRLRTTKAIIIGRVIHAWRLPRDDCRQASANLDGTPKTDAS